MDFDLPGTRPRIRPTAEMTSIGRSERNVAHRLVEEFMLADNHAVAHYSNAAVAALHRVHEKPDARKVLEFEELARAFGYSLGVET